MRRYGPHDPDEGTTVTVLPVGPHFATGKSRDAWESEEVDVPTPDVILRQRRQLNQRAYYGAQEAMAQD